MDKVITRSLLRAYYNGIKSFLKTAEDSEINTIINGISFDDAPVIQEKRHTIKYTHIGMDRLWTWQFLVSPDDIDSFIERYSNNNKIEARNVAAKVYSNTGELVIAWDKFSILRGMVDGQFGGNLTASPEGVWFEFSELDGGRSYVSDPEKALIVDGQYLFELAIWSGTNVSDATTGSIWLGNPANGNTATPEELAFINACNGGYIVFD